MHYYMRMKCKIMTSQWNQALSISMRLNMINERIQVSSGSGDNLNLGICSRTQPIHAY